MQNPKPIGSVLCHPNIGSYAWWKEIEKTGTPLHSAIDEDNTLVSFIWRDPAGKDSNTQSVYIDLYSKTPHPTKQLTCFRHIQGTDVWYWQTTLANDWFGSYFLMPVSIDQTPPEDSSKHAIRQWWIQLMAKYAQADPLNKLPAYSNGNGLQLSAVSLQKTQYTVTDREQPLQNAVQKTIWKSQILNNERSIWCYKTGADSEQTRPLVLLLDGQHWAEHLPIYATLDELTAMQQLPPALYVLIDSIDTTTRCHELACNPIFIEALQEELLPWLAQRYRLPSDPYQTIIAGQSLGGLCALYAGLYYANSFASIIAQSGSFWWPDVNNASGEGELFQALAQLNQPALNIVLSAGCYEQDMLESSMIMAQKLQSSGHHVDFHEFNGGHDRLCWRQDLLNNLVRIFSSSYEF